MTPPWKTTARPKASSIDTSIARLEDEWLPCARRKSLIRLIDAHVLPHARVEIDSALCLGLGSFRAQGSRRLRFLCLSGGGGGDDGEDEEEGGRQGLRFWDREYDLPNEEEEGEAAADDEHHTMIHTDSRQTRVIRYPWDSRSVRLYQLLLFETVLERLRIRFNLTASWIQDPQFRSADRAFLQKRGHTVVAYPTRLLGCARPGSVGVFALEPAIRSRISSKTFIFAPRLDISVCVDAIVAARPCLYWGYDMCLDLASPYFLHPNSPGHAQADTYAAITRSYTFVHAPIGDGRDGASANDGFMVPADTTDARVMRRVRRRVDRAEAEVRRLRLWMV